MALDWAVVQNALIAWLKTGSGYGTGAAIWRDQNRKKPATDFLTAKVIDLSSIGMPDVRQLQDLARAGNGTTTVGTEIEFQVDAFKRLTVSVQAHTSSTVGSGKALAVLSKVQTSLHLETVRSALRVAGLAPFDFGQVQDLSAVVDTEFEGRAALTCGFYLTETLSDYATYIERANLELTLVGSSDPEADPYVKTLAIGP
jgi:hypothetical protein